MANFQYLNFQTPCTEVSKIKSNVQPHAIIESKEKPEPAPILAEL